MMAEDHEFPNFHHNRENKVGIVTNPFIGAQTIAMLDDMNLSLVHKDDLIELERRVFSVWKKIDTELARLKGGPYETPGL